MPDAPRRANRTPPDRPPRARCRSERPPRWPSEEPSGGARRRASCHSRDGRGPPRARRGAARSRADPVEQRPDPRRARLGRHADLQPDPARRPQTVRDRLAMEEVAVPGGSFERVTQRVAKVQCDPPTAASVSCSSAATTSTLAQPARSTTSATAPDSNALGASRAIAGPLASRSSNSRSSPNAGHLDRLAERGPQLALRERLESNATSMITADG